MSLYYSIPQSDTLGDKGLDGRMLKEKECTIIDKGSARFEVDKECQPEDET